MTYRKIIILALIAVSAVVKNPLTSRADVAVGSEAPTITVKDSTGNDVNVKNYRGKTVVLEWFNPNCPFVKKFYSKGAMQATQERETGKGIVWLTVSSSAVGKSGYLTPELAESTRKELNMKSTALLLDTTGELGKAFGARTTPHMFVIDKEGKVAYAGAIDSISSTSSSDVQEATNYVVAAADALAAGKPVDPSVTEPYGCAVKY